MITKHFVKILLIFSSMIILGLIGVSLVSHFDQNKTGQNNTIAK